MKPLTIIIPNKVGESPDTTIASLYRQSFLDFELRVVNDFTGNANRARNEGFKAISSKYVLFSDNDIEWQPGSLASMFEALERNRRFTYAYGWYEMEGKCFCKKEFNGEDLRCKNYISTMSMIRAADHPGFDETIRRLQDWDVWLTLLERGKKGIYVDRLIFKTAKRNGITYNSIPWEDALKAIERKHKIITNAEFRRNIQTA